MKEINWYRFTLICALVVFLISFGTIFTIITLGKQFDPNFWLEYFGMIISITAVFTIFSLSRLHEKKEREEKEKAIIETFKKEINENEKQLKNMLSLYASINKLKKKKIKDIFFYRDLSTILCERVLKDINPERTDCHIEVERLRSTLTTLNNFNKNCREGRKVFSKDFIWAEDLVSQAQKLIGLIRWKLRK